LGIVEKEILSLEWFSDLQLKSLIEDEQVLA
jgi:hypothetical protein